MARIVRRQPVSIYKVYDFLTGEELCSYDWQQEITIKGEWKAGPAFDDFVKMFNEQKAISEAYVRLVRVMVQLSH